jgi:hypothetical protein
MQQRQETADAKREAVVKIAKVEREGAEARKKVARNLKAAGVTTEIIMQATGLSLEEVDDI